MGKMKVLLIEPLEHPQAIVIEHTLESMHKVLDCECIDARAPWKDRCMLVTDDESLFSKKMPNRYILEMGQPIFGNFFICGVDGADFCSLPDDLMEKYTKKFWVPEMIVSDGYSYKIMPVDDGTRPA